MRIERDIKLDYSDVLIRPKRSTIGSRKDISLSKHYKFLHSEYEYHGIPLIASNMDGVGTFAMSDALQQYGALTCIVKSETVENWNTTQPTDYAYLSMGISQEDYAKAKAIMLNCNVIKGICIDVANGYSQNFIEFVNRVRTDHPDKIIIAGNVVTPDVTEELLLNGADIVKVGIGPGAMCKTRIKTGIGYPQLSAVIECADAAHGIGGHIIADGGCTSPGDIAKAFGAGADFVMLGSMLAGHDEGGGDIIEKYTESNQMNKYLLNGEEEYYRADPILKQYVEFYGMSSKRAQEKHDGFKDYRASEGRVAEVPYRGSVHDTFGDILGGLRSACTYVGAKSLKELPKRTTFIQVNDTHTRTYEGSTIGE